MRIKENSKKKGSKRGRLGGKKEVRGETSRGKRFRQKKLDQKKSQEFREGDWSGRAKQRVNCKNRGLDTYNIYVEQAFDEEERTGHNLCP